jgi:CMP-N,N'-diacetyllegionaminic acid synthase
MTVIVALVPARAGSKGVPDKNIRPLAGQPLLAWSVRAALRAGSVDRVIVSTDSIEYADIARDYGAEVPFLRSEQSSNDGAGDEAVVAHYLDWLGQAGEALPDYIVYLRPTTPLRSAAIINEAVKTLMADETATSLRSVHEMAESAYKTFEQRDGVLVTVGSGSTALDAASGPRQSFPKTWIGNGYVDVFRAQRLIDGLPLYGDHVRAFETAVAPEIDTVDDFDYLQYLADRDVELSNALFQNNISELKVS